MSLVGCATITGMLVDIPLILRSVGGTTPFVQGTMKLSDNLIDLLRNPPDAEDHWATVARYECAWWELDNLPAIPALAPDTDITLRLSEAARVHFAARNIDNFTYAMDSVAEADAPPIRIATGLDASVNATTLGIATDCDCCNNYQKLTSICYTRLVDVKHQVNALSTVFYRRWADNHRRAVNFMKLMRAADMKESILSPNSQPLLPIGDIDISESDTFRGRLAKAFNQQ